MSRNIRQLQPAAALFPAAEQLALIKPKVEAIGERYWQVINPLSTVVASAILKPALFTALSVPISKVLQEVYEPDSTLWNLIFPNGYFNVDNPAWIGREKDVKT